MVLSDDKLDLCNEKLQSLDHKELQELINDLILHNWTNSELIDMIEKYFTSDDWEWFYDEYVVGVPDV